MRTRRLFAAIGALGLMVIAVGWRGAEEWRGFGMNPSLAAMSTGATVTGVVKFRGTPPTMPAVDMSKEPECRDHYASPPRDQAVVVDDNGALSSVFVYVKAGLDDNVRDAVPRDSAWIDQVNCRYEPHVLGAQVGQRIAIRNSDSVLHNVNAKPTLNRGFNISQPAQGMVSSRKFRAPEVMVRIVCDVHGWMTAYVGVLPHPYFVTTGDDGSFAIPDLPPGTYTIEAWHEKYGTQTVEVTVGTDETKAIEFTFEAG